MIYDKPLIFYPIETLRELGITDIVLSLGDRDRERFYDLLGSGKELGVKLTYHYHGEPKGIAYAINSAREELGDERFLVHLGDNIFCNIDQLEINLRDTLCQDWIYVWGKEMPLDKVKNYGVAEFKEGSRRVCRIIEKPEVPPSNYAILGLYLLDDRFFDIFKTIKPSKRGEYEITDALTQYGDDLWMFPYNANWMDCGTFEDIYQASEWRRGVVLTQHGCS